MYQMAPVCRQCSNFITDSHDISGFMEGIYIGNK